MTVDDAPPRRPVFAHRVRSAALASLIPWTAFILTLVLADRVDPGHSYRVAAVVSVAPFYLGFVALPSVLPLVAARHLAVRLGALVVMTTASVLAAVAMATSGDAQAGLQALWVPIVAVPASVAIWLGETIATLASRRSRKSSAIRHRTTGA